MPVTPTYPGVYIEEVPSGVRTITGVATSITAFIGRALRGPTDRPRLVQSFAEFSRVYGGLWVHSLMTYAVQQYFLNGGRDALIVRMHNEAAAATLTLEADFDLVAASEGDWGERLRARVDHETRDLEPGEDADTLFNLSIKDTGTGTVERFLNVSTDPNHRCYVVRVLELESNLVRIAPPGTVPALRPEESSDPPEGADPLEDDASSSAFEQDGSDGDPIDNSNISDPPLEATRGGLWMLEHADLFNILCIPPLRPDLEVNQTTWDAAAEYVKRRRAMLIVDAPAAWDEPADITPAALSAVISPGDDLTNAALYFPRIRVADPLRENRLSTFVPCGAVAGIYARTDAQRGVWKAPAGLDANVVGVAELTAVLTDGENDQLGPRGINCLRTFPTFGCVVWGARTLRGADQLASEWKYIPVRRVALFLEESLYRGTQWVVFEPNDEPLWAQIRMNVGAFMQNLFRQGAFQGRSPHEAYFVKCDGETTTQNDINLGVVNILVGFAPLKPAEFVVIRIRQIASQAQEERKMAQFSVNAQRFDPYKNFKFRVKWGGRYVAGVSKVSALKRSIEIVEHREGGDPSSSRKSPGRTKYEAITLERGVTHDPEFEKWATDSGLGAEASLKDFRKDILLEIYNEAGQLALAYKIFRCWVSEYQVLPDFDANANTVAIEHIKLENEGWERDYEVPEAAESSVTEPPD